MSRFFRGGDDSSSESSSDEEELYGSDEEQKVPTKDMDSDDSDENDSDEESESESSSDDDDAPKKGLSRFLVDQDSSESEESGDEAGTAKVKSAKDKRHDELEATINGILNGQKINDWVSISNGVWPPIPSPSLPVGSTDRPQSSTNSTARLSSSRMEARRPRATSSASPTSRTS